MFELARPGSRKGVFHRVALRALRLAGPMASHELEWLANRCGLKTVPKRGDHNLGYLIAPCSGTHGPGGLFDRLRLPFPVRWDDRDRTRFAANRWIYWAQPDALRRLEPELRTSRLPPEALEVISAVMPELVRMRRHWRGVQDRVLSTSGRMSGLGPLGAVDWRPSVTIPEDHYAL